MNNEAIPFGKGREFSGNKTIFAGAAVRHSNIQNLPDAAVFQDGKKIASGAKFLITQSAGTGKIYGVNALS
jgi:hypothetical protein